MEPFLYTIRRLQFPMRLHAKKKKKKKKSDGYILKPRDAIKTIQMTSIKKTHEISVSMNPCICRQRI